MLLNKETIMIFKLIKEASLPVKASLASSVLLVGCAVHRPDAAVAEPTGGQASSIADAVAGSATVSIAPMVPGDHLADAFPLPPGDRAQWLARQVDSVRAATRAGDHPERLTSAIEGAAWDRAAYARDPLAYLSVTEPARAWQDGSAVGLPELDLRAPAGVARVAPGGSIAITVRTTPYAPVSALATAGGAFDNGLASATVAADADGLATLTWTATSGTVDMAGVTIASPGAIGVAKAVVMVTP
jgi:antitoxin (DNA-binding transcriptional repressor) of toxin-antitoxin stability system